MDYILPAAYCRYCGMFALDEVWEGIERVDGTRSVLSTQDQKAINLAGLACTRSLAVHGHLLLDDARRI